MRCLAFAEGLESFGVDSVFVMKAFEPSVEVVVRSKGHAVETLPPELSTKDEVRLTCELAERSSARLIITDVCHHLGLADRTGLATYHRALERSFTVVVLTGSDLVELPGHVIVSPYFRTSYPRVPSGSERLYLLGPEYFIFRNEFVAVAAAPRSIAPHARRVLVTIGGSDELRLTAKVVRALAMLSEPELSARVVLGPGFPPTLREDVCALLATFQGRVAILGPETNVADAMLWADLAITGDGLTKYETAVTGTPSLMLSRPDGENVLNAEFASAGTTVHVGDGTAIGVNELAGMIRRVAADHSLRDAMSRNGKGLVDGHGLDRILARLPVGAVA